MPLSGSDAEVMWASLRDPEAFGVLFDRHFRAVVRFVERRLGAELAPEIAAEVFVIAFNRRTSFDRDRTSALPWLLGIASNQVLAERRRYGRYLQAMERLASEPIVLGLEPGVEAESAELVGRLRAALLTFGDVERELLLLLAWEGLSYEEAAEALGLPIGTVRSKVHRTRARLRDLVRLDPPARRRARHASGEVPS